MADTYYATVEIVVDDAQVLVENEGDIDELEEDPEGAIENALENLINSSEITVSSIRARREK
jgi:hypothetical protein